LGIGNWALVLSAAEILGIYGKDIRDMRLNHIPSNIEALIPNPSPKGRREADSKSLSLWERDLG
jgi:hypothetical protein